MNLSCPHCQELIPYDPKAAGSRITCSYCKRPVLIPQFQALPPELQQEYREEVEKARKKQEAALRKQQEAEARRWQAEEDQKREEAEKVLRAQQQAEEHRRQQELETEKARQREVADRRREAAQKDWNARVEAVTNEVPEEAAVTNRYPALKSIADIVKIVTVLVIIVTFIGWGIAAINMQNGAIGLASFFVVGIFAALLWMFNFAIAEMILLAIDVANDLRINRFLLKAIRYNKIIPPDAPSAGSAIPTRPTASPVQDGDRPVIAVPPTLGMFG